MSINIEGLLAEISPDAPCGENLEYDPAFTELERVAAGTPETQFSDAEPPDWKDVRTHANALCERTKDLRVLLYLAASELHLDGITGLRDVLKVIKGTLEDYWERVYPLLDAEDNNDPLERMNALANLAPPAESRDDPIGIRDGILDAPLCDSRQAGKFTLRDILISRGEFAAPEGEGATVADSALINAAFEDTDIEELRTIGGAAGECAELVTEIDKYLTEKVGTAAAISLDSLIHILVQARIEVEDALERRGYGSGASDDAADGTPAAAAAAQPRQSLSGTINSQQDVLRAFDKICDYYERQEPSSPVPILIKRARRLVCKSFVDIIRDMTPDSMSNVDLIAGTQAEQDAGAAYQ